MALTATVDRAFGLPGGLSVRMGRITLDGAYPTGGWSMTAALLEFGNVLLAFIPMSGVGGYIFEYVMTITGALPAGGLLKALYPQGGEQVGGALGAASVDAGAVAVTSSAANGGIVTVDAGKGREVAASTAGLSGLVLPYIAFGY